MPSKPAGGPAPTISAIVPNHNHGALLPRAVAALRAQDRPPDEIILVDDASTDDSAEAIDRLAARHPELIAVRLSNNVGVLGAFEAGLQRATGDWFYGAGADDEVLPGFFRAADTLIRGNPLLGIVCGQVRCAFDDHRGEELQTLPGVTADTVLQPDAARRLLDRTEAGASLSAATLYRRTAFDAAGGFPRELGPWADTFIARVLAVRHGLGYLALPCVRWHVRTQSYSHRRAADCSHMRELGDRAVDLLRRPPLAGLFDDDEIRRWRTRWELEMAGGFDELRETVVPRRLRDARRAYAELGRAGNPIDRLLSAALRRAFARSDAKRLRSDPGYAP